MDLFRKCMDPVEKVLRDAKMDKGQVNEVVLVSPGSGGVGRGGRGTGVGGWAGLGGREGVSRGCCCVLGPPYYEHARERPMAICTALGALRHSPGAPPCSP